MKTIEKTIKNNYGEKIMVKLENGKVLVHHTDATDSFIPLDELFLEYILDGDEVIQIYNVLKEIFLETPTMKAFIDNKTIPNDMKKLLKNKVI